MMKQFENPQIKIFEFLAKDTIITASSTDGSEGVGGIEGVMPTSINPDAQNTQVSIDTMTK